MSIVIFCFPHGQYFCQRDSKAACNKWLEACESLSCVFSLAMLIFVQSKLVMFEKFVEFALSSSCGRIKIIDRTQQQGFIG